MREIVYSQTMIGRTINLFIVFIRYTKNEQHLSKMLY